MTARDDDRSARQIARGKMRKAGDRSARLASALMKLSPAALDKLVLEDELREAIDRARAITAHIARRRAERTLAGDLRRFDVADLDDQLEKVDASNNPDVQQLHLAEKWRARMIEEGIAAVAEFPGGGDELPRLVHAAQRERDTGRPPGAARALFRHIVEVLKTQSAATAEAASTDDIVDDE
jgi:ribosome-associated protein